MRYLILAFLIAIGAGKAFAEECQITKEATLPITFDKFIPTVPVTINGHVVRMGIDTGAEMTVINPEAAARLGLPKDPRHSTKAQGVGGTSIVANVIVDDFEIADSHYLQKSLAAISTKFAPATSANPPMAGLIGADILSDYDVEFDFPAHRLTLYEVSNCTQVSPPWQGEAVKIPTALTSGHRFVIPVIVDEHKLTAVFDTGASGLRLSREAISQVGVTEDMLAADPQRNGSGVGDHTYRVPSHLFDSLIIGREIFHQPRIDIVDFSAVNAPMLVGEDYMHARRFWLSYATGTIWVQRVGTIIHPGN